MKKYVTAEDNIDMLTPAQIATLADIYEEGDGVERDVLIANNLYWWSAELGDPYAQSVLANAFTIGRDIKKGDEQALFWYKKSAEQGNLYAQYEVGMRISEDKGTLLRLHASAKQGFTTAMKELSDRLHGGDPRKSKRW